MNGIELSSQKERIELNDATEFKAWFADIL